MILLLIIPILWCLGNVKIDAYRILHDKKIAHKVNGGLYIALFCILSIYALIWVIPDLQWYFELLFLLVFAIQMFCARQIWFDIPLNLRRKLKWFYMSTAIFPESWWDRMERALVGVNGKLITIIWGVIYVISTVALFLIL